MFKTGNLKELLDFIVKVSKNGYHYSFYKVDHESNSFITSPMYIEYNGAVTEFHEGEVPFNQMACTWEYKDMYFRACTCVTKKGSTIAFAPDKGTLFNECWCIDIPLNIHDLCYSVNKL